jgi:hypothetical protein
MRQRLLCVLGAEIRAETASEGREPMSRKSVQLRGGKVWMRKARGAGEGFEEIRACGTASRFSHGSLRPVASIRIVVLTGGIMKTRGGWRSRNPTLANVLAAAVAVMLVGIWVPGVLRDDVAVPVRHGGGRQYHFHGVAAWLLFAGFVCLGASVLLAISRRRKAQPGEKTDQRVAGIIGIAGAFIILAMMVLKWMGLV